jgi:hypothetical protein
MNLILENRPIDFKEMLFSDAEALFEMDSNLKVHQYSKPLTSNQRSTFRISNLLERNIFKIILDDLFFERK